MYSQTVLLNIQIHMLFISLITWDTLPIKPLRCAVTFSATFLHVLPVLLMRKKLNISPTSSYDQEQISPTRYNASCLLFTPEKWTGENIWQRAGKTIHINTITVV